MLANNHQVSIDISSSNWQMFRQRWRALLERLLHPTAQERSQPHIYRAEQPIAVTFDATTLIVTLADGRVIVAPLVAFHWLRWASAAQRSEYALGPTGIYWPEWDDGIDIDWLIETYAQEQS